MSDPHSHENTAERLIQAYERMLERARGTLEQAEKDLPALQERIREARERAVELGELTREEAERVSEDVRRDLHDTAEFMYDTARALRDWIRFDLDVLEDRVLGMFAGMADQTRLELDRLAARAREAGRRHTGEVTAAGVLRCEACGKEMHFKKTGHIPPCPQCHATVFRRVTRP